MNKGVIIGGFAKIFVIIFTLINTRYILDVIGAEGLAIYSTIISLTSWFALLNMGLPITIQNTISELRVKGYDYLNVKKEAYGAMVIISSIMLPLSIILGFIIKYYVLDDYLFLSVWSIVISCIMLFINGQSQIMIQIMYAEHKVLYPNLYPAINASVVFILLLLSKFFNKNSVDFVLAAIMLASSVSVTHALYKSSVFYEIKINIKKTINYIRNSSGNLLFAFLSASTLSVDYLVMSMILGTNEIVMYSLTARLFGVILIVHNVMIINSWSIVSEKIYAKDKAAAKKKIITILMIGIFFALIAGVFLLFFIDVVLKIWTGGKIIHVEKILVYMWFVYIVIRVWTDTFAMVLLSVGKSHILNLYVPIQAIISVASQYYFGGLYGAKGVVGGLILSFIFTASWILPYYAYKKIL